jgi:hypothetical protein
MYGFIEWTGDPLPAPVEKSMRKKGGNADSLARGAAPRTSWGRSENKGKAR